MIKKIILLSFLFIPVGSLNAQQLRFSDSGKKAPWCGFDLLLEKQLKADTSFRKQLGTHETALQNTLSLQKESNLPTIQSSAVNCIFTIPTVVHIIHNGTPEGTGANLSVAQIQSQIDAANRDMAGANICLCLVLVDRISSPLTNHNMNTQEAVLKAVNYFQSDMYLNVWVVQSIAPAGVAGYARFPGSVPPALDGIVMRYDVFGSNCSIY